MKTPEGMDATGMDKIMLLNMWTQHLKQQDVRATVIFAGMGKPTFQINPHTVQAYLEYWKYIERSLQGLVNIEQSKTMIDYGDPRGEREALADMSAAMTEWYGSAVAPENILFTVGGAGALRVIFNTFNALNTDMPHYRVLTPFPHYTLYADNQHSLHPIPVMEEKGYRISKAILDESLRSAQEAAMKDGNQARVLLLCNPNNPLGTVFTKEELNDIAQFLRENPDLHLVLDEAYAEMVWLEEPIPSILELAPDIKERISILRSATKAHSAAGERMAVLMSFDRAQMNRYRKHNISLCGHAPRSAQLAYASTMKAFGENEKEALQRFYEPKLRYVHERVHAMKVQLPDQTYRIDGTFYVMLDLSELFGMKIPPAAEVALGHGGYVQTSEELIYSLLFEASVMIAPGQYFGLPEDKGYCRITCSGNDEELKELMDRIEAFLLKARLEKRDDLYHELMQSVSPPYTQDESSLLEQIDISKPPQKPEQLLRDIANLEAAIAELQSGKELESETVRFHIRAENISLFANTALQKNAPLPEAKKGPVSLRKNECDREWQACVCAYTTKGPLRDYLLKIEGEERLTFKPWAEHQQPSQSMTR